MVAIFQKNNIVFTTYKFALTCMSGRFIFVLWRTTVEIT